ncbi:Nicotinate-nucleotide adenylyltransferase [Buchnera aphidicola (Neophyllaphis podocarpi)]|uniref:nicotinate-nucleotide adenylyltransferase n=1 Tax=Buchnera aphidicola TaxID=9 RepID=UPI003464A279
MKKNTLNIILGGTFDPIHYGHLNISKTLAKELQSKKITLIPNKKSLNKIKSTASIKHRLKMIKLAIKNNKMFNLNYLEIKSNNTFYTIDTLKKIRKEIGYKKSLAFIIGEDNLIELYKWHKWKKILKISHLIVYRRKIINKKNKIFFEKKITPYITNKKNMLTNHAFGLIFISNAPFINLSSTQIRKNIKEGISCNNMLPKKVLNYINKKNIYF